MSGSGDDSSARLSILAIGVGLGLYGLVLAWFGQALLDHPFAARGPLLTLAGVLGVAAGALAIAAPAFAGLLLVVVATCWFGFGFLFADGATLWVYIPLALSIIAIVLAFRVAGASEVLTASDRMSIWVGKLAALTIVILTVVVCYEVFMRYVLRMPTRWGYDAGYMLYGAGFILAGAYALAQNSHVRADVIYRFWPPRVQASVDMVLFLLFFFPAAFFFIYQGYLFAERSWMMREFSSASPFNIPVYHYKTLIPIAGMLLFVQGIAELIRAGLCLRDGQWPPRVSDVAEIDEQVREGKIPSSIAGTLTTNDIEAAERPGGGRSG